MRSFSDVRSSIGRDPFRQLSLLLALAIPVSAVFLLTALLSSFGPFSQPVEAANASAALPTSKLTAQVVTSTERTNGNAPGRAWLNNVQDQIRRSEYHITWQENVELTDVSRAYQAPNRAHHFRTYFSGDGIEVRPRTQGEQAWRWKLQLTGYGYGERVRPVVAAQLAPDKNQIVYRRGALREWYVNDKRGLKQNFTLDAPPPGRNALPSGRSDDRPETRLVLELSLDSTLTPALNETGTAIDFSDAAGNVRLRYSDLYAYDADGRTLAASMDLRACDQGQPGADGCLIRLLVDDRDARYPITIDPTAGWPDWDVGGGQSNAEYASTVAIAGDVNGDGYDDVLVGAPSYDGGQNYEGRVFLYEGSSSGPSTTADWSVESNASGATFGQALAAAGDVNDDGYDDVIIGAPGYSNGAGLAVVYYGASQGFNLIADWYVLGSAEGDQLGASVAGAGDVNGDGYDDVMIGAPYFGDGQAGEGQVAVYYGSGSGLPGSADWTAEGDQVDAHLGMALSRAGDVDDDGYDDILVAAPDYDDSYSDEGRVFLYAGAGNGLGGSATWTADGGQAGAHMGAAVAGVGDLNGDGYDDVATGAADYDGSETDAGLVAVYYGDSNGLAASADWTLEGAQAGAALGQILTIAGDVNGDGYDELFVGAPAYNHGVGTDNGAYYVYHGRGQGLDTTASWTTYGPFSDDGDNSAIGGGGDVNGDGYADLFIGLPGHSSGGAYGVIVGYFGSDSGLNALADWTAEGEQAGAHLGQAVAGAGDVNGDGYDDILIGADEYDNGQGDEGRVFVYHGSLNGLSLAADWTFAGSQPGAELGATVAAAGDANGDGYGDVLIAEPGYDAGATTDAGRVHLFFGSGSGLSATADWTAEGTSSDERFGSAIAGAGDVDDDGYTDLLVGAPDFSAGDGHVVVYYGGSSGPGITAGWILTNSFNVVAVAGAGDVNGDGYADILIGSETVGVHSEGGAYVFHGSSNGITTTTPHWSAVGAGNGARFGAAVAAAGDVDDDGYDDVIIGAPRYSNGVEEEGQALVYGGSAQGLAITATWAVEGEQYKAWYGSAVGTAGDFNGDGYDDIMVSAPRYDDGQADEGAVFVYYGSSSGPSASEDWRLTSDSPAARIGNSIDTAGDVNGDGYSEIIIGGSGYEFGQEDEGLVFVFYGSGSGPLPPIASFSGSPLSGTAPLDVAFVSYSANASAYQWQFGDGITSTLPSPDHSYSQPGVYDVTLTVAGPGGSDTLTRTAYITVTSLSGVTANFSATPTSGEAPLAVQFTDESTPGGAANEWQWDFGDGSSSLSQHPVYTYTAPGVYTVTLTITDTDDSETDSVMRTRYITVTDGSTVIADFSASPLSGSAPLTVTFTNESIDATDYLWQFGDGVTATISAPVHTYEQGGVYTVILTASNAGGSDTLTRTNYITVTRAWRPVTTTTDPPVWGEYAAAYDSNRDVVVLYGGNASGWPYENTTWEYDGSDWTAITTTQQPAAVYGMQSVFDGEQEHILLFGGSDSDDAPLGETRIYSGTAWTSLAPAQSPSSRTNHALAYEPVAGHTYLFGGNVGSTYFDDLWRYDNDTWTQVVISGTAPAARTLSALVYDAITDRLLLFGGRDATGTPLADLWSFDTSANVWTELAASGPSARYAHALAYDPASGATILVGGVVDAGDSVFGDTWQFQNGAWRELESSPLSDRVAYHTLVYHESARVFVLVTDGETWEYR